MFQVFLYVTYRYKKIGYLQDTEDIDSLIELATLVRILIDNNQQAEINRIGENRGALPFDIDGAVIKVDDFQKRAEKISYL